MANWITNGTSPRKKSLIERNMDDEGAQNAKIGTKAMLAHLYDKPVVAPVVPVKKPSFVSKILSGFAKFANTPIAQPQFKAPLAPVQTKNTILSNLQNKFNNSAYLKKVNAATANDIANIDKNKQANIFKDQSENAKIKNPIAKFLTRTSQSAGNMATLGNGPTEVGTGNKVADFAADTIGSIGGAMFNPLGAGETLYSGATKFVGNPIEKALAKKIGTETALKRFGTGVAGSSGTMSAINAGLAAPQATNIGQNANNISNKALAYRNQKTDTSADIAKVDGKTVDFGPFQGKWGNKIKYNSDGSKEQEFKASTGETMYLGPSLAWIKWQDTSTFGRELNVYKQAYLDSGSKIGFQKNYSDSPDHAETTFNEMVKVGFDKYLMKDYLNKLPKDQQDFSIESTLRGPSDNAPNVQSVPVTNKNLPDYNNGIDYAPIDTPTNIHNNNPLGNNVADETPQNNSLLSQIGNSIKQVGKAALTGAVQGALFGGVLHGAKEGNILADKSISKSMNNIVGNADLGTGSKSISRYTPKTNNVIPMIAKPTALNSDTLKQGNTNVPVNTLSPLKTSTTYAKASVDKPSTNNNGLEITPAEIKQQQRQEVVAEPLKSGEVPTKLSMNVVSGDKGKKFSFKNGYNSFYTHVVDKNKAISNFSKDANKQGGNSETYMKATNAANVSTRVNRIMDQGLRDRSGKNIIDVSYKQLVKSMPKDKQSFTNYLLQNHNIDRSVEGKAIDSNYSASQSHQAVLKILQDHPEYKAKGKEFTGWINKFMGEYGNKSGLISDDLWKNLNDTYKNYLPTNRDFTDIEGLSPATNGKGFTSQSIPLKKLSKTSTSNRDIVDPYTSVMNTINRTVRGATNNDVAQSMLKDIQANPEGMKKWGEVIPEGQKVNDNVKNVVTVLDKGKKVNVQINDINLLKSLEGFQKGGDHPYQDILRKITQPYKDLITTKNPLFAVGNTTRDFVTAYVNGSVHNPIKYIKNYISAGKDLTTNSPIAQQYRALGGGGSNFDYNSSKATASLKQLTEKPGLIKRAIMKPINGIEAANNVFESIPRLSEFKATLKKGGSLDQAIYNGGEVGTNFSRGGNLTKALDSGVPYLNASVQGLDKFARQFIAHPIGTTAKGIISVTIPTIAVNNLNKDNPNYQKLDNRTKDTYFCFPNPWGEKDSNGNATTFIKIPKAREYGVLFGSLAERIIRQNNGETNAFKGFTGTALTNFAPANPLQNNLFSPLETYLPSNKDFAGRTIVPQSLQTRSNPLQYDETTSEIGKKLGALTGFSPKKIDYILKSYLGIIGQIGLPMATKQTYAGNTQGNLLKPILTKFTADPLYSNQDVTDFYDNLDKATKAAADNNFTNNVDPNIVTDQEYAKSALLKNATKMSDLVKAATAASQAGDDTKARAIRQQMVDLAKSSNADIGQEPNQKIMDTITNTLKDPNGALDASGNVKSNNGDEAQALRKKVTALKDQSKNSTISDVDMRSQLNDLLSQAQNTSMPTTEFTTAISDTLKYNTSKEATAIRAKVTQITHSNLSVVEQRDILQGVVDEAKNAPVKHAKPRAKKNTLNPFNK